MQGVEILRYIQWRECLRTAEFGRNRVGLAVYKDGVVSNAVVLTARFGYSLFLWTLEMEQRNNMYYKCTLHLYRLKCHIY
jgi:hypothetical protein